MQSTLEMQRITKSFGGVKANDDISLEVFKGEIHALLGENGAGKTTLMNVLYGLYKPDFGTIKINGKETEINSPLDAIAQGIGMIHQHFMLIPAFTVLENIVLGLRSNKEPFLDLDRARIEIEQLAAKHGLKIFPDALVQDLSTGLRQQVEIVKVLYRGANILILDEPTGVLTPQEMVELFNTLKELRNRGHSVIFISHKLEEVMTISDRVSVLRKGRLVSTVNTKETTKEELARLMVGREVVFRVKKEKADIGEKVLEVRNLCVKGIREASSLKDISFHVNKGEILGVAGVDGNGQSELMEALAGLRKVESGEVLLYGESIRNLSPHEIINKRVSFIPEERKESGIVKGFDIDKNMILRRLDQKPYSRYGVINSSYVKNETDRLIQEYDIRLSHRNVDADLLSGGNLQKVILAREISSNPILLLAMHPTRGLDVGAIEFIHRKMLQAAENGVSIIIVSTELEELLTLADRIIVFCDGRITGELKQAEATIAKIGELMAGIEAGGK